MNLSEENIPCCFCHSCGEDGKSGKFFVDKFKNIAAHQFCLYFSAGLAQNGYDNEGFDGFLINDVIKEARRSSKLKCKFCHMPGASLGCGVKSCRYVYHFKCGLLNDVQFMFKGRFNSFCKIHRSYHDMSAINSTAIIDCPVCLESITSTGCDILKMPCCKNKYAHKECVQKQALASGYFFKCPTCNNVKQFRNEMSMFGIYIPQRDAVWEENDAYDDLLHRYDKCDIKTCFCEFGNQHSTADGDWMFVHCSYCGQSAVHSFCFKKMISSGPEYICSDCANIVKNSEQNSNNWNLENLKNRYNLKPCYVKITRMTEQFINKYTKVQVQDRFQTEDVSLHKFGIQKENDLLHKNGIINEKDLDVYSPAGLVNKEFVFNSVDNVSHCQKVAPFLKTEQRVDNTEQCVNNVRENCEPLTFTPTQMSNVANRILSWIGPFPIESARNKEMLPISDHFSRDKKGLSVQNKGGFSTFFSKSKLVSVTGENSVVSIGSMSACKPSVTFAKNFSETRLISDVSSTSYDISRNALKNSIIENNSQTVRYTENFVNFKDGRPIQTHLCTMHSPKLCEPKRNYPEKSFDTKLQSVPNLNTVIFQTSSNKNSVNLNTPILSLPTPKWKYVNMKRKISNHFCKSNKKRHYIPHEQKSLDSWIKKIHDS
ncbi:uncharacterized protein LOC100214759 isoform X2 [Hydra vulgaris]|uniref:Uncharacterized protein LOC100214759 isoform X2 n=1 Tax=Hydra vulgaris TaxID=6087 RepID=A0ABM4BS70_HYDVU